MRHGAVGEVTVTIVRWGTSDHRWTILHTKHSNITLPPTHIKQTITFQARRTKPNHLNVSSVLLLLTKSLQTHPVHELN